MSHHLPPEEGRPVEPPSPPRPYPLPPDDGPYAPSSAGNPYAPPGGPYAQPPHEHPYAQPPPGGPYAPSPPGGPYQPSPRGGPYTTPEERAFQPPGQPYGAPPGGAYEPPFAGPPGRPIAPGPQPGPRTSDGQGRPSDGPVTEIAPAPRKLGPRARRTTEILALAVLLPLLLGLHWYDDRTTVRTAIERPEVVTVVARGKTATLNRVQWTLLGRDMRTSSSATPPTPGRASLRLILAARPLDAKGAEDLRRARFGYRIRDREGHIWTAGAPVPENVAAGTVMNVPVTTVVPPDRLTSVVLEIVQPKGDGRRATTGPLAVLRFAH